MIKKQTIIAGVAGIVFVGYSILEYTHGAIPATNADVTLAVGLIAVILTVISTAE